MALALIGVLSGCGGEPADEGPPVPGRAEFRHFCGACHGRDGMGVPRLFPPLAGSEWATGPAEVPIRVALKGLEGRLVLRDAEYMNVMPPLEKRITDKQLARVLTYVRSAWGNSAGAVTPEDVAAVRASIADRDETWSVEEMEAYREELARRVPTPDPAPRVPGDDTETSQ